jgi:protein ImuA
MPGSKTQTLAMLKAQVARLERRPALAESRRPAAPGRFATPPGHVHEIFADSPVEAGAALGFALAQARGFLRAGRPGLLLLQLRADAQELGFPFAPGLAGLGLDAEAVVLIRTETIAELLWAMEEALACRAVAAVVADLARPHKALDFTASRRLALRCAAAGGTVLLVRYGLGREASAARYRWRVGPARSPPQPFDPRAPGPPRWRVTLEKGSIGRRRTSPEGESLLVEWTENGIAPADIDTDRSRAPGGSAPSRAAPAALGHRLSQAG